jgi:hypothetical protein
MICCEREMQLVATAGRPEFRALLFHCLDCEKHSVGWEFPPGTPAWMNAVQRHMLKLKREVIAAAYAGPTPIFASADVPALVRDLRQEEEELQRLATETRQHLVVIECTTDEHGTRRTVPTAFNSRKEAEDDIVDAYSVDNPQHVTPAAPGDVSLKRIGPDEWDVSGPLVGEGVIQRVKIISPQEHEQLRLIP